MLIISSCQKEIHSGTHTPTLFFDLHEPFQAEPDDSMIPREIAQPPAAVPEIPELPPDAELATSALARKDTTQLEAVGWHHFYHPQTAIYCNPAGGILF